MGKSQIPSKFQRQPASLMMVLMMILSLEMILGRILKRILITYKHTLRDNSLARHLGHLCSLKLYSGVVHVSKEWFNPFPFCSLSLCNHV